PSVSTIEETITRTECRDRTDPGPRIRAPHYLELDPTAELPPHAARLDRLIRSILVDPRWLRGADLDEVATRAAARQTPAANPGLIRAALRRITPWRNDPAFQGLRAADPASITHNLAFTMPYPLEGEPTTVLHGTCDVVYRDRQGECHVMLVADRRACPARQRLRLRLSGLAAQERGFAPVRQGWLIRHGADGETTQEAETGFDPAPPAQAFS